MSSLSEIEMYAKNLKDNQIITVRKDSFDTTDYFASIVTMDPYNPTSVPLEDYIGEPSEYFLYDGRTICGFKNPEMEEKFRTDSDDTFVETYGNRIASSLYKYEEGDDLSIEVTRWKWTENTISRSIIFSNVLSVDVCGLASSNFLNIKLPKCTNINKYGFVKSKVRYLNCPKVTSIKDLAFYYSDLREINIESYNITPESDRSNFRIFCQCFNLRTVYLKSVDPDGYNFSNYVRNIATPDLEASNQEFWWYWPVKFYGKEDGNVFEVKIDNGGSVS